MHNPSKVRPLTPFGVFFGATPVLPSLYWNVYSAEQRWKAIGEHLKKLCDYVEYLGDEVNVDRDTINQLLADFETFKESGFIDYYEELIQKWIDDNFGDIISYGIKQVYFGLTSDGYFCAYIPESWSDIVFDTGMVYGRSDYGRLILRFASDGSGVIDNTYGYSLAQGTDVETLIRDLEVVTNRSDETYDAVFTNMEEVITHVG